MTILDIALGFEGVPAATIAELDRQLPAIERLVKLYQQAEPDIAAITPVVLQLIAFIKQKENVK